jgi:hypothetical protein
MAALYTIKGEGHQWPGGKWVAAEWMIGRYSRSIDATRQMWAFFNDHPPTLRGSNLGESASSGMRLEMAGARCHFGSSRSFR